MQRAGSSKLTSLTHMSENPNVGFQRVIMRFFRGVPSRLDFRCPKQQRIRHESRRSGAITERPLICQRYFIAALHPHKCYLLLG